MIGPSTIAVAVAALGLSAAPALGGTFNAPTAPSVNGSMAAYVTSGPTGPVSIRLARLVSQEDGDQI